mmetsp:Transcript_2372/g.7222  ORF Transcript_2372/g.7222 Transcript_2372/m.7222 type:complete len:489 (-) Transcript_2372:3085-4551(-)
MALCISYSIPNTVSNCTANSQSNCRAVRSAICYADQQAIEVANTSSDSITNSLTNRRPDSSTNVYAKQISFGITFSLTNSRADCESELPSYACTVDWSYVDSKRCTKCSAKFFPELQSNSSPNELTERRSLRYSDLRTNGTAKHAPNSHTDRAAVCNADCVTNDNPNIYSDYQSNRHPDRVAQRVAYGCTHWVAHCYTFSIAYFKADGTAVDPPHSCAICDANGSTICHTVNCTIICTNCCAEYIANCHSECSTVSKANSVPNSGTNECTDGRTFCHAHTHTFKCPNCAANSLANGRSVCCPYRITDGSADSSTDGCTVRLPDSSSYTTPIHPPVSLTYRLAYFFPDIWLSWARWGRHSLRDPHRRFNCGRVRPSISSPVPWKLWSMSNTYSNSCSDRNAIDNLTNFRALCAANLNSDARTNTRTNVITVCRPHHSPNSGTYSHAFSCTQWCAECGPHKVTSIALFCGSKYGLRKYCLDTTVPEWRAT